MQLPTVEAAEATTEAIALLPASILEGPILSNYSNVSNKHTVLNNPTG